jgi:hypothetical protein
MGKLLNQQWSQCFKSKMQVKKDLKEQTRMLINPTSHNLKRMTRLIQSESQKRCTHETNDLL